MPELIRSLYVRILARPAAVIGALPIVLIGVCCLGWPAVTLGQDQFVEYFSGQDVGTGDLGAFAFDADGNFWTGGFQGTGSIRRIEQAGGFWTGRDFVPALDWAYFYRSDNIPSGSTHPDWGGTINGAIGGLLLNPAPLTVQITQGNGTTVPRTYQPGELAFITDGFVTLSENGVPRDDVVKKLYRYDLREIDAATSDEPDYKTAGNGTTTFGELDIADWNDVLTPVVSKADMIAAAGTISDSSTFARNFAWSSDGQSIYAVDSGAGLGGIYKVDATQTGVITQIWKATTTGRINSEPAVVHTSVRNFNPASLLTGDQIVVEGSAEGGNEGGVNVYLDPGGVNTLAPPIPLFTADEFADFSEYRGTQTLTYPSFTADPQGNIYFFEARTGGVYLYDTAGRLAKIASELEHNLFQKERSPAPNPNDSIADMQMRTSTLPGFEVPEIMYSDFTLETPIGILVYQVGDFDRNNVVDQGDLALFANALGTRGQAAEEAAARFDLNGNAVLALNSSGVLNHVTNGPVVVDWKDVKILQQFTGLVDGDANFDGSLDLLDIDIMNANYFTVPGQTSETWASGDFASADPLYPIDAPDANLVNEVDLLVLAGAWVNQLGQSPPNSGDLQGRGLAADFIIDVLDAFAAVASGPGDYNGDGQINAADYTVWRDEFGQSGPGLAADGDGNELVDVADYQIWKNSFAAGGGRAAVTSATVVPEPSGMLLLAVLLPFWFCCSPRWRTFTVS